MLFLVRTPIMYKKTYTFFTRGSRIVIAILRQLFFRYRETDIEVLQYLPSILPSSAASMYRNNYNNRNIKYNIVHISNARLAYNHKMKNVTHCCLLIIVPALFRKTYYSGRLITFF